MNIYKLIVTWTKCNSLITSITKSFVTLKYTKFWHIIQKLNEFKFYLTYETNIISIKTIDTFIIEILIISPFIIIFDFYMSQIWFIKV